MRARRLLTVVFACAAITLASLAYEISMQGSGRRTLAPATEAPASPTVFQPEAQLLSHAMDPRASAGAAAYDRNSINATDTPLTAASDVAPYAYDPIICQVKGAVDQFRCLDAYYRRLVREYGADTAFADIKRRYAVDPMVVAECHPLMHGIGQEASKSYATVSEAYLHGDSYCWSGYYHGILEGVIERIGLENLPDRLNTICADIPGKRTYSFDYYNCVHGLGHGIMEALEDEVPEALKMCDRLDGSWEKQSCYSGVFMENIISNDNALPGHVAKYLKPSDPLFPCGILDDAYRTQCYLGQTSYALEVSKYDFAKVAALCVDVDAAFKDTCFQSYGRDAANQAYHDPAKTKETCWLATDSADRMNCATGAAKEFVSYYHSDDQAKSFCGLLDDQTRSSCLTVTEKYYELF